MEVDVPDAKAHRFDKDQSIKDFERELNILRELGQTRAKNINAVKDAFTFYSSLWLVTDFCFGGSVRTLMKAKGSLEEKFIIPIARELLIGLQGVHKAGIVHRDLKAANVLITESGQVQLADFGVSTNLDAHTNKRNSQVGSIPWMAPEMWDDAKLKEGYGTEIDIWGFGCTVYEMAMGMAPAEGPGFNGAAALKQFLKKAPRISGTNHSAALQQFAAFCLVLEPHKRPSTSKLLNHSYIKGSEESHPTSSLRELIETYFIWETAGGQRQSLFNDKIGASGFLPPPTDLDSADEWNFNVSDEYVESVVNTLEITALEMNAGGQQQQTNLSAPPQWPRQLPQLTVEEAEQLYRRAGLGRVRLERLFRMDREPYDYETSDADIETRLERQQDAGKEVTTYDMDQDMGEHMPAKDNSKSSYSTDNEDNFWLLEDEDTAEQVHVQTVDSYTDKRASLNVSFSMGAPNEVFEPGQEENVAKDKEIATQMTLDVEDLRAVRRRSRFFPVGAGDMNALEIDFQDMVETLPPVIEEQESRKAVIDEDDLGEQTRENRVNTFKFPPEPITPAVDQMSMSKNRRTIDWTFATSSAASPEDTPVAAPTLSAGPAEEAELNSRPSTSYYSESDLGSFDEPFGLEDNMATMNVSAPSGGAPSSRAATSESVAVPSALLSAGDAVNVAETAAPTLARAPSVKASMEHLRREADEEEDMAPPPEATPSRGGRHAAAPPAADAVDTGTAKAPSRAQRRAAARKKGKALPAFSPEAEDVATRGVNMAALEDPRLQEGAEMARVLAGLSGAVDSLRTMQQARKAQLLREAAEEEREKGRKE